MDEPAWNLRQDYELTGGAVAVLRGTVDVEGEARWHEFCVDGHLPIQAEIENHLKQRCRDALNADHPPIAA